MLYFKKKKVVFGIGLMLLVTLQLYFSVFRIPATKTIGIVNGKMILFWGSFYAGSELQDYCIDANSMNFCPFKCVYSVDPSLLNSSDAIVIHGREEHDVKLPKFRSPAQRWVFLMFESPANTWTNISNWNNVFNWTMSYRSDSDIPISYGKFLNVPKSELSKHQETLVPQNLNLLSSLSQKKLIAWAVTNCKFVSSGRRQLVDEISKYLPVDTYGACGQYRCVRSNEGDQCMNPSKCHEFLATQYKFYLAFENSLCQDYITEKFFNAFKYGMVPIVYGLPKEFYLRVAPNGSFIHLDDFSSIKQFAEHLQFLDVHPKEYLKYFEWRSHYSLDKIYYFTKSWCSLCEKLHTASDDDRQTYSSIYDWWFYKNDQTVQGKPCYKPLF